ncbi:H-type small acid-soluble spore protein [Cohnella hongkongensis]|uniref:H-type small acid-soluble spore protein n=1 Tax=Cohnella hongkongensis TaxID=178337 RepID=A0ABV9F788_9BACL
MNKQRAQEISESPVMANVTYEGMPVYIQHVDHEQETARVYPLANREEEMEVSVEALTEG